MQCATCKYFAVPLTEDEKKRAHCPGGDPKGEPTKKICMLQFNPDFDKELLNPENCTYYFPSFFRFR